MEICMTEAEKRVAIEKEKCMFRLYLNGYTKEQLVEIIVDLVKHDEKE
jgi:hypothetical protein